MSKEVLEKIKSAEERVKTMMAEAEREGKKIVKTAETEIFAQRKVFSEKLRAERNERLRRSSMQTKGMEDSAQVSAEKDAKEALDKYKVYHDAAVDAAINVLIR